MVCKNIISRIDGRGGKGSYECQLALPCFVGSKTDK